MRILNQENNELTMKVVFSIGGSILAPDRIDTGYVDELSNFLNELSLKNQVAVVVGGGKPARRAISEARARDASWAECDHIGVLATRENAKALAASLSSRANHGIPETIHEAVRMFGGKILVMGGTEPGHSTDAVAALIAEWVKADLFINASNVDAVYDKNPKEFSDAKPYEQISIGELLRIVDKGSNEAGKYPLLDHTSAKIIERSQLRTVILDGRNIPNMKAAIEGRPFKGTTVTFR